MNELKLSIAREIAQHAFGDLTAGEGGGPTAVGTAGNSREETVSRIMAERMAHSACAIANPNSELLYSAVIERQLITSTKIDQVIPTVSSLGKDDRCSMHTLVVRTIASITVSYIYTF